MITALAVIVVLPALVHWHGSPQRPVCIAVSTHFRVDIPAIQASDGNAYDLWWKEREARAIAMYRQQQSSTPQPQAQVQQSQAFPPLPLNVPSVAQVLTDFVQSTYARQVFNFVATQSATEYGTIEGMFESVKVNEGGTIVIKLKPAFSNVEGLLDRITRYLRARIPQIAAINVMHRDGMDIF